MIFCKLSSRVGGSSIFRVRSRLKSHFGCFGCSVGMKHCRENSGVGGEGGGTPGEEGERTRGADPDLPLLVGKGAALDLQPASFALGLGPKLRVSGKRPRA